MQVVQSVKERHIVLVKQVHEFGTVQRIFRRIGATRQNTQFKEVGGHFLRIDTGEPAGFLLTELVQDWKTMRLMIIRWVCGLSGTYSV